MSSDPQVLPGYGCELDLLRRQDCPIRLRDLGHSRGRALIETPGRRLRRRAALLTAAILAACAPVRSLADLAWWNGFAPPDQGGQGFNGPVRALALYQGELVAGGDFTQAGGVPAAHVALWDGVSWQPLGDGTNDAVWCLLPWNGSLVAGGAFTSAGGVPASRVARWDGTSWSPLGSGADSTVACLGSFGGALIVGGYFVDAGGAEANYVAAWDGSSWSSMGSGMDGWVYALASYGGQLVAGGFFNFAGDVPASRMAAWDGSAWSGPFGTNNGPVWGLTELPPNPPAPDLLVAVGFFELIGQEQLSNIAAWDGVRWQPFGAGLAGLTACATPFQGQIFAGGNFSRAGGDPAARIARWDGADWFAIGSGTDAMVRALLSREGSLFVGGDFRSAGGLASSYIARLDDTGVSAAPGSEANAAHLLRVDPNPSSSSRPVRISLRLPEDTNVRLTLHDSVGELIAVLANGGETSGEHELRWDGRNLRGRPCAAGLYWLRLDAGGHGQRCKVLRLP